MSKSDLLEIQDKLNACKQAAMALRLAILGIGAASGDRHHVGAVDGQAMRLIDDLDELSVELEGMRREEGSS